MTDIKSLDRDELKEYIISLDEKAFRASQVYDWIHKKLVSDFDEMTNIPKSLIEKLKNDATLNTSKLICEKISQKGDTKKYLFGLSDGNCIESVWMKYRHGNSVCISSQVGCRMGCKFCASTLGGLVRNLTPSEMLEQVYAITRLTGERVSNIVIMGSGEPFDNFETVIRFVRLISDDGGLNISKRNITISTCGIVPGIKKLADLNTGITLAISLHAYNDEKRKEIMPVANAYSIKEILDACRYYFDTTGRRVSFEYSLIAGVNDGEEDARGLVNILKNMSAHVNLIPVNPVKERNYTRSDIKNVLHFQQILEKNGLNATIRREMGKDIEAACGQLRRSYEQNLVDKGDTKG